MIAQKLNRLIRTIRVDPSRPRKSVVKYRPLEEVALRGRGYNSNQLLRDIDDVSMARSLEIRVPFLDPEVTDAAISAPGDANLGDVTRLPAASTPTETPGRNEITN